jgi:hypothetical protein
MPRFALIVLAFVLAETAAIAQSAAGHAVAMGLLDGCRTATVPNVNVIFVGRRLIAADSGGSRVEMQVEIPFRGITSNTVSVSWRGDSTFDSEQSYIVAGHRATDGAVVEIQSLMPATTAAGQRAVQLFTSALPERGYVTVMGVVEVGSHPHSQPSLPVTGLRIRLLSEGYARDLFTQKDGSFSAAGVPPGRLELTPFLPPSLKVFDIKTLTYTASPDSCVLELIFVVSSERGR